jgi:uncharacterized membrane protein YfcA
MTKLCIFGGMIVASYAFWFLGEKLGLEIFGCFVLSGAGSLIGTYAGWKLARKVEE